MVCILYMYMYKYTARKLSRTYCQLKSPTWNVLEHLIATHVVWLDIELQNLCCMQEVLRLDWQSSTRVMIHIADYLAHGDRYNDNFDDYPNGDPTGTLKHSSLVFEAARDLQEACQKCLAKVFDICVNDKPVVYARQMHSCDGSISDSACTWEVQCLYGNC